MTRLRGQRPPSIQLFAISFLAAAAYAFITGLNNLDLKQVAYNATFAWDGWNRDWTIVTLSAIFSIALIPVSLIYFFASRVARWLVTIFTLIALARIFGMVTAFQAAGGAVSWGYFAQPALLGLALISLFLPASNRWFSQAKSADPETFA